MLFHCWMRKTVASQGFQDIVYARWHRTKLHGDVFIACYASAVSGKVLLVCEIKNLAELVHIGLAAQTLQGVQDGINGFVEFE